METFLPSVCQHEYTAILLTHDDGTMTARGGDIPGLVLEADTLDEMLTELRRIAPRLPSSNHATLNVLCSTTGAG